MTNSAAAIKMLITYAICIPGAIFVGYLITNPLDYGTLGILGLILALIFSPIFIKWHYPIMVFGLGCPMYLFFLKGDPPLIQVVVILSLGIAIIERTLNSDRRFISVPSMAWPLYFTAAMVAMTAKLTGGIGLHTLGGGLGGGQKYIAVFVGIATYFALTSRTIPKEKRGLYIGLFYLSALPAFISDLFPVLPSPLNYINLLFPPSALESSQSNISFGITRLGSFATSAAAMATYMLAKYGLRGIFLGHRLWRAPFFILMLILTLLGGFRVVFIGFACMITMMFFVEGLHRTRLLLIFIMGITLSGALLVPFANKLPYTFQRAMSFLPFNWDASAKIDAQASAEWRYAIWRDTWPKVPDYLLLGKGYALHPEDFDLMGNNSFANGFAAQMDASNVGLAVSSDYHSGPLSTLMPFGIWGAISLLWLLPVGVRILYRNFKYGDSELKTVNAFLLVGDIYHILSFLFIFGSFSSDLGSFAKDVGFSIALNWGVRGPLRQPISVVPHFKRLPQPQPA